MFLKDKAPDGRSVAVCLCSRTRKTETRLDIGHKTELLSEYLPAEFCAVRLIAERQQRCRMGMKNKPVRKKRMQQSLDRRRKRVIDHMIGQIEKIQIKEVLELPRRKPLHIFFTAAFSGSIEMLQFLQGFDPHRRKIVCAQSGQIDAASFDKNNVYPITDNVVQLAFHRSIAAAMHHQTALPSEQTGGINQFGKFRRNIVCTALPAHRAPKIRFVP